jgi:hypothetical protein
MEEQRKKPVAAWHWHIGDVLEEEKPGWPPEFYTGYNGNVYRKFIVDEFIKWRILEVDLVVLGYILRYQDADPDKWPCKQEIRFCAPNPADLPRKKVDEVLNFMLTDPGFLYTKKLSGGLIRPKLGFHLSPWARTIHMRGLEVLVENEEKERIKAAERLEGKWAWEGLRDDRGRIRMKVKLHSREKITYGSPY